MLPDNSCSTVGIRWNQRDGVDNGKLLNKYGWLRSGGDRKNTHSKHFGKKIIVLLCKHKRTGKKEIHIHLNLKKTPHNTFSSESLRL